MARYRHFKKMAVFLWSNGRFLAVFHQIWTPEGPNVVKIISARVSDPFSVIFPGGKFWYHVKKNWPTFGPVGRPDLPYAHFFYEKIFFRPALFLSRLEQPKRPPNAPGLASVPAAVLSQHYFHRRPPTAPPARRSREALVHWCGSVHTAH